MTVTWSQRQAETLRVEVSAGLILPELKAVAQFANKDRDEVEFKDVLLLVEAGMLFAVATDRMSAAATWVRLEPAEGTDVNDLEGPKVARISPDQVGLLARAFRSKPSDPPVSLRLSLSEQTLVVEDVSALLGGTKLELGIRQPLEHELERAVGAVASLAREASGGPVDEFTWSAEMVKRAAAAADAVGGSLDLTTSGNVLVGLGGERLLVLVSGGHAYHNEAGRSDAEEWTHQWAERLSRYGMQAHDRTHRESGQGMVLNPFPVEEQEDVDESTGEILAFRPRGEN